LAAELDSSTERIINYLSDRFGVPINTVFFRYFKEAKNEYLAHSWLPTTQSLKQIAKFLDCAD
jgi:hypothetical protein